MDYKRYSYKRKRVYVETNWKLKMKISNDLRGAIHSRYRK